MADTSVPVAEQVARVADRLSAEYADRLAPTEVRHLVDEAYAPYEHAKVTQFVPVLVARSVRQRLRADAR